MRFRGHRRGDRRRRGGKNAYPGMDSREVIESPCQPANDATPLETRERLINGRTGTQICKLPWSKYPAATSGSDTFPNRIGGVLPHFISPTIYHFSDIIRIKNQPIP